MLTNKKSQAGFSLVELMVVVAIIGVLAAVAVPQVTKYIAKARQSEAKANLASLYSAEKAFFAEYNIYDPRFGAVGFAPEGNLRYNLGFMAGGATAGAAQGFNTTVTGIGAERVAVNYCLASGAALSTTRSCSMLNGVDGAAPPALTAAMCAGQIVAGCVTASTGFSAAAVARIMTGAVNANDAWSIDSGKQLRNTVNGL